MFEFSIHYPLHQLRVKDEKDHPPRFVKIDFGAACRHAVARDVKTRLDPYTTSRFYTRFNIYKMFALPHSYFSL